MVDAVAIQGGELVRAAAQGDAVAFTELVTRHHRDLLRVAYVICRDSALAEDSAQAAWAIAWRRLGEVKDAAQVRGWLVAVAANEARRIMRSRRHTVREISVTNIELVAMPDRQPDPLARGIDNADLRRALAALDPTERALIALRFIAELGSDDIGRALVNAEALRGTTLFVAYGNGEVGTLDNGQPSPWDPTGEVERAIGIQGAAFVDRLGQLNIPVTVYDYGNGTHFEPYFQRDLHRSVPLILDALGL